ncbi:MAG: fructosamine kinase family protein [Candidatus Sumerlaeota bacterium]|nr:fructosamine kinase family protein [Candidatus Sumerlaeota bacterium]
MADQPIHPRVDLRPDQVADALGAWLGAAPEIHEVNSLSGGCVDTVLEVVYGAEGERVVLKVSNEPEEKRLGAEFARLQFYRGATRFPVPEPRYCDLSGQVIPHSYYLMERLEGVNLSQARWLSDQGYKDLQGQIGRAVAELHQCHAPWFGPIGEALPATDSPAPEQKDWWRWFHRMAEERVRKAEGERLLADETLRRLRRLLDVFERLFAGAAKPTLVHGDIWATNVIVAPRKNGEVRLSGFVDPSGLFAHPEYELAYLEIWQTVGQPFFDAYREIHPIDEGYPLRRPFYWLNTLVQHVNAFKTDNYLRAATDLIDSLWAALTKKKTAP